MTSLITPNPVYCQNVEDHDEIREFVLYSCWCTPGLNILYDKSIKKTVKHSMLVEEAGIFGPMIDMVIRGSIPHVLVKYFSKDTKAISECSKGSLKTFLLSHFKCSTILSTIELWFKNLKCVRDYEHAFRSKRSELLSNQIFMLKQRPIKVSL